MANVKNAPDNQTWWDAAVNLSNNHDYMSWLNESVTNKKTIQFY